MKKSSELFAWEWPGFFWYQGLAPLKAWLYDFKKYGCEVNTIAATFSQGTEAYYFNRQEYTQAGKKFLTKIKASPDLLFNVLGEINIAADKILDLEKKWTKINFSKLDNKGLLEYHKELFELDETLWRRGQIPNILELSNSFLTDYVKDIILTRYSILKLNSVFTVLTTSHYSSRAEQQDLDLLTLFKKYGKFIAEQKNILKKHCVKYSWMTYGWAGPALSKEYFKTNFIIAAKNPRILKNIGIRFNSKKNLLVKQANILTKFEGSQKKFLIMLRMLVDLKAKRVDAHSLTYFLADKIMTEIGIRLNLSLNQMRVIPPNKVSGLFKSKLDIEKINKQYKRVLVVFKRPKINEYVGKKAESELSKIIKLLPKIKSTKKLTGELAYPGRVKGRVKIILDSKDSVNFKPGEILITRMTDPNYLPIMKLSKAIVTDIGGITCHAAIVSRELHKPCIVGTKFATKVFKDGDIIQIDADKGIVRKIK